MRAEDRVAIRVVDLIKGSYEEGLNVTVMPDEEDVYACLGHFDVMRVRLLNITDGRTLFETIAADPWNRDKQESYMRCEYPLYILRDKSDVKVEQMFWSAKYPCMLVSRIHFDITNAGNTAEETAEDTLKRIIKDKFRDPVDDKDKCVGDLSVKIDGFAVHCLFGQTLELGDTTVILKSCSLNACLEIVQCLLGNEKIGDIYSYCGLHRDLFNKGKKEFSDEDKVVDAGLSIPLPQASMRFSVRSAKIGNKYWELLGIDKDIHFVIGTADALVNLCGKTLRDLVEMLIKLYSPVTVSVEPGDNSENTEATVSAAFDDVVTRVGISADESCVDAKEPKEVVSGLENSKKANEVIISQVREIESKLQHYQFDWLVAFSSQIRMLLTMKSNCVMDDLSLLIWPSAKAFVDRLQYIINNNGGELTGNQVNDIQCFLDSWMKLSNDIFHLESQLMQNPKLQAPRVYVPATLLAFYMAFLKKLDMLLKQIDSQEGSGTSGVVFVPLIVHDIGLRANTLCIHDPADDVVGKYQGQCALIVTIPVSLMFKPERVIAILGHEYLHYSGEAGRLREERLQCILESCAGFILNKWHMDGRSNNYISLQDFGLVTNSLRREIMCKLNNCETNAGLYIRQLAQYLTGIINDIYLDWDLQSKVLIENIGTSVKQEKLIEYLRWFFPKEQYRSVDAASPFLSNLLHLYKESYADVAAIKCLGLNEIGYLNNIILPEFDIREKYKDGEEKNMQLELLCLQAALVCSVIWGDLGYNVWGTISEGREIAFFIAQINQRVDIVSRRFKEGEETLVSPQYEYLPLKKYLDKCAEEFETKLKNNEDISRLLSELKGMYKKALDKQSGPSSFRHDIDWYHTRVGEEINKTV